MLSDSNRCLFRCFWLSLFQYRRYFAAIMHDISERKQLEDDKDSFIAFLSHEVFALILHTVSFSNLLKSRAGFLN